MARTKLEYKKERSTPSSLLPTKVLPKVKRVANCVADGVNHYPNQEIGELKKKIVQGIEEAALSMQTTVILCFKNLSRGAEIRKKIKVAKDVDSIHLLESQRIIIERIQADNLPVLLMARLSLIKKPLEADHLRILIASCEANPTLSLKEALEQELRIILLSKALQQQEERKLRMYEQIMGSIDLLLEENKAP